MRFCGYCARAGLCTPRQVHVLSETPCGAAVAGGWSLCWACYQRVLPNIVAEAIENPGYEVSVYAIKQVDEQVYNHRLVARIRARTSSPLAATEAL